MKNSFKYNFIFIKRFRILFLISLFILNIFIFYYQIFINKVFKRIFYKKNNILSFQEPKLNKNLPLISNISSAIKFDKCLLEEFEKSKMLYKESLDDNIDLIKNLNIIVFMLAGRRKYLEYNLQYMRKLLNHKLINEVDLWLYTNNKDDIKYIKDNSNLYKTCGIHQNYSEIFTEVEENTLDISVKTNNTIFIKLNNLYEIILNNNINNYIYICDNNKFKNIIVFNTSIIFSENYFTNLKISIKENFFIIEINNTKYLNYKNIENTIISKIEIKSNGNAFWKYKQIKNRGIFLFIAHNQNIWSNMLEAYNYYLNKYFDIIIKIDDDIIYFSDTYSFTRYVYFTYSHPEVNCVYSNSLNNLISFTYSGVYGLIDNYLTEVRKKTKINLFKYSHFFFDYISAKKLHYSFLENPRKYLQALRIPINIDNCFNIFYKDISGPNHPFYTSCHVFAFNKKNYNFFFNLNKTNKRHFWDERYLLYKVKKKVFYPNFYTIHHAYSNQRKNKIYNAEEIFEKYQELKNHTNF